MPHRAHIVVIGSANMDLVCRTPRMPRPGETILGGDFVTVPGGKGANQAVAASRLAIGRTDVHFVGRVGSDLFGEQLLAGLKENRVRTDHVAITSNTSSGVAMILVDRKGENSIVVAGGANARFSPKDIDAVKPLIESAACVVMQLEVPLPAIRRAIAICRAARVFAILDPAPVPASGLPRALLGVDLLTPNQLEAGLILGIERGGHRTRRKSIEGSRHLGAELLARGPKSVVLKLGARGSILVDRMGHMKRSRPFKVNVVDTTAAGDAFTGALAVAHSEQMSPGESLRFANAAGALACATLGAQPSLPMRGAVERLLARH
jgi:ribokinase